MWSKNWNVKIQEMSRLKKVSEKVILYFCQEDNVDHFKLLHIVFAFEEEITKIR